MRYEVGVEEAARRNCLQKNCGLKRENARDGHAGPTKEAKATGYTLICNFDIPQ
jgi:hypothetical protein